MTWSLRWTASTERPAYASATEEINPDTRVVKTAVVLTVVTVGAFQPSRKFLLLGAVARY